MFMLLVIPPHKLLYPFLAAAELPKADFGHCGRYFKVLNSDSEKFFHYSLWAIIINLHFTELFDSLSRI